MSDIYAGNVIMKKRKYTHIKVLNEFKLYYERLPSEKWFNKLKKVSKYEIRLRKKTTNKNNHNHEHNNATWYHNISKFFNRTKHDK